MSGLLTTTSHAKQTGPGFIVKLVLMALINAFGVYGILASWRADEMGVLIGLVVAVAVADWIYFSKRAIPGKYLYPGLLFLLVFQVYVMLNTAYVAFTNYGSNHNSTKQDSIEQILRTNDLDVPNSPTYQVTVLQSGTEFGFAIVGDDGTVQVGTTDSPLAETEATVVDGKVTEVPGWDVLNAAGVSANQGDLTRLRVPLSDDPEDGSLAMKTLTTASVKIPSMTYDATSDTFTSQDGTLYHADDSVGFYTDDSGKTLLPGWRVLVGTQNFTSMITDRTLAGPFFSILLWTFAFAILSVLTTFALGLLLAVVFNDPKVKGRRIYRSLFILPYAFPGFLAALVWKGLFNERFGFINTQLLGGADVPWFTNGTLAKVAILLVNLWLGFPYMFLICTGALQSIPSELTEAGIMDGAGPWRRFRSITLPLLMVSVAPLLIASFAFNFNNFTLIFMLTGGGPNYPGLPYLIGETDILISMVYSIGMESGTRDFGLASALSIMIFAVVGLISWLGFRQTRKLEEIM